MRILFVIALLLPLQLMGQGFNHQWLLGNHPAWPNIGRLTFTSTSYSLLTEQRKMPFKGTQGNISDANGNFLMSSNGVWIANANNDTMMNGGGLNPGVYTSNWPNGFVLPYANVFLPFPGDSSKYLLFHHAATFNGNAYPAYDLFYSVIDISLDSGLGSVVSKNNIAISDTLGWGIGACKHANGRDWWVVMMKDSSDKVFKILFTPNGVTSITYQSLNYTPFAFENSSQLTFSQDGTQFITTTYDDPVNRNSYMIISDFNRCTGIFSNTQSIQLTSGSYIFGTSFSPSGKYAYACSSLNIFQIDTDSLTVTTVATYDGFVSPGPNCCSTKFWNMYLAANGKIYISSGSGVRHIHEMNYPDSIGAACDVQQHAIYLGNYPYLRAVPNHPNYYLGPVLGSVCDSLALGLSEYDHDFKINISPNPTHGQLTVKYSLPQNESGKIQIINILGEEVYSRNLPPWSSVHRLKLDVSSGLYQVIISTSKSRGVQKIMIQ
jgi:type IX secretion system substrate protein